MRLARTLIAFVRRCLLALLLVYWAVLAGGTLITFVSGGLGGVAHWYRHIFAAPLIPQGDGFVLAPWDLERIGWSGIWAINSTYFVLTVALSVVEWRTRTRTPLD